MKKVLKSLIAAAISATFVFPLAACSGTPSLDEYPSMVEVGSWIVTSPDGDIRADMKLDSEGSLTYTIKRGTEYVVEPSNLGLDIVEDDLRIVSVDKVTERRLQGVYANKSGKTSSVEYDCNELTLTLKGYKFYLDVVMRAYDDGYAFRYNLRAIDGSEGTVTVESENSEFAVPSTATIWTQVYQPITGGNFFAYENSYVRRSVTGLQGEYLSFPMLYRLKKSDTYSLVTESELIGSGFYGSFLKESEDKPGTGILQTVPTPAGCMENDNQISYPFTSPWRVGITGDLNTVIESELVEKVYGNAEYWKPDNYDELSKEEQEIYNYDWVDSGVAAWNWLIETSVNGNKQQDYEMHRRYLHLASDMGWKYVLLDSGWERDVDPAAITAFMQEAKNLGVKVLVWCNSLVDFPSKEYLQYTLDRWAAYGIAGIKIDFFDGQNAKAPTFYGEDTETIAWYETIYQECAKRKMLVNCHGSNKPTGERRVYEQENSAPTVKADALIDMQGDKNSDTPLYMAQSSEKKTTKKQLFEELYKDNIFLKYRERRAKIIAAMRPYFDDEEHTALYVDTNLNRKRRNLIVRRIRLTRKANLQNFNYFVTYTYADDKHTEESFKKKLKSTLGHFCSRKSWRYIGIWERSPEKKRLHFHGIFDIPEGTMPGLLFEKSDYSFNKHRRLITVQNTYFNDRFGRCDFEEIEGYGRLGEALAYIMKYIEKSGEKIVYSKGLPQFFISDIMTEDVVCKIGMEDSKLLLYDDFRCWDDGVLIGTVGLDTIQKLRKSN